MYMSEIEQPSLTDNFSNSNGREPEREPEQARRSDGLTDRANVKSLQPTPNITVQIAQPTSSLTVIAQPTSSLTLIVQPTPSLTVIDDASQDHHDDEPISNLRKTRKRKHTSLQDLENPAESSENSEEPASKTRCLSSEDEYDGNVTDTNTCVSHLVLVVHGIGQKLENTDIRATTEIFAATAGKVDRHSKRKVRIQPVDWRSNLFLDFDVLQEIIPLSSDIRTIREKSFLSLLDIFYYNSPVYGQQIIDEAVRVMNKSYDDMLTEQPSFKHDGQVSIVAHSLGSIIVYDILTAHCSAFENFRSKATLKPQTKLKFKVNKFFAMGSPLSLFLSMRDRKSEWSQCYDHDPFCLNEICSRAYNIIDPNDPISFKWDPLIQNNQTGNTSRDISTFLGQEEEQEQVRKYDYYVNGTKINKRAKAVGYVWKIAAEGITGLRAHTKYWKNEGVLKFILEKIECS
ncbi:phospholipase DDHD1-like isoform X2 [Corticium candelabrum]|uniref:phospholipase DDHD1-like isoform X2 n=1 Tax=Corticium candelabrum TaxID=121492 RepID=UPI002E26563F|nr:phospholipase DDHD1-like isoform X2 [Corticium candelabrum]